MTAMQFSLFDARSADATVGSEPSVNARNAKRQLDTLRQQLATAKADLEDVDYNLSIVAMHQRASREGKIDANWWDAAMRFGMLDPGEEPVYRLGSYPVKVMRWIFKASRIRIPGKPQFGGADSLAGCEGCDSDALSADRKIRLIRECLVEPRIHPGCTLSVLEFEVILQGVFRLGILGRDRSCVATVFLLHLC